MDKIIDAILAPILDKFKASNPRLWLLITFALTVIAYGAQQGEILGLIKVEGTIQTIVTGVVWLLALLNGSRTTNILKGDLMAETTLQLKLTQQRLSEIKSDFADLKDEKEHLESMVSEKKSFTAIPPKKSNQDLF